MINSMTAYGAGQIETEHGILNVEVRSVNNRYLDLNLRIPEDLRFYESDLRQLVSKYVQRGKLEIKLNYSVSNSDSISPIDEEALQQMAAELALVRKYIPDIRTPQWADVPRQANSKNSLVAEQWQSMCTQACTQALNEFKANRSREGARLAAAMLDLATECEAIVASVEQQLPSLIQQHHDKITQKLSEALAEINPDGFSRITGPELSARIAQEASLFGLKVDVEEELTRQKSHIQELKEILQGQHNSSKKNSSNGKRLDFLFQEMNREANTMGSKSAGLAITQAAIDLKLLIEQLREQAQNIE